MTPTTCPYAVMQAAAEEFGLTVKLITTHTRARAVCWPRQVAMFVMHHHGLSHSRITRAFRMRRGGQGCASRHSFKVVSTAISCRGGDAVAKLIERINQRIEERKRPVDGESLRSVAEWCKSQESQVLEWCSIEVRASAVKSTVKAG